MPVRLCVPSPLLRLPWPAPVLMLAEARPPSSPSSASPEGAGRQASCSPVGSLPPRLSGRGLWPELSNRTPKGGFPWKS